MVLSSNLVSSSLPTFFSLPHLTHQWVLSILSPKRPIPASHFFIQKAVWFLFPKQWLSVFHKWSMFYKNSGNKKKMYSKESKKSPLRNNHSKHVMNTFLDSSVGVFLLLNKLVSEECKVKSILFFFKCMILPNFNTNYMRGRNFSVFVPWYDSRAR